MLKKNKTIQIGDSVCIPANRIHDGFDVWGTVTEIDGATAIVTSQGQPRAVSISRLRTATQMDRRAAAKYAASAAIRRQTEKSERIAADIEAAQQAARNHLQFAGVVSAGDPCVVAINNRITPAVYLGCGGNGGDYWFRVDVDGREHRAEKLLHQSRQSNAQ